MISLDIPVKEFIDGNWLAMGIFLIMLKSVSRQFKIKNLMKIYMVFNNALEFIRPSSHDTQAKIDENEKPEIELK
jgi:hypothetical protein